MLVVERRLLRVAHPQLDVIPAVEGHEVFSHQRDSTAVAAGRGRGGLDGRDLVQRPAQALLLDPDDGDHPDGERDDRRREERRLDRVREAFACRKRQLVDAGALAACADARRQAVVDDRAHDRDAERRADLAPELRQRGRRADVRARDGVLNREHEHLHHRADADAGDDHVARRLAVRRRDVHPPEQQHPRASGRAGRARRSSGSARCVRRAARSGSTSSTAPSISGVRTTPDEVADVPITPCTKSGTYEIVPNIAIPTSAMQATLPATIGLRRISNGRIGSRARRSTSAKTASRTAATTSAPTTCALAQGYSLPPQTSPSSSAPIPAASTPAPSQSIEWSRQRRAPRHRQGDDDERDAADRQVDEEDPAPARVVDDEAADRRPDDRRRGEDRADQALPAAAVARRDDVADHGEREREQPAGADALHRAEDDELGHRRREAAERRAEQEDDDREEEQVLAAVDVAELPVERHGHRRGEHVRREDPRVLRDPAEVADDARERGRDDRLVERGEEERHHQPRVDREDAPDREVVAGRLSAEAFPQVHPRRLTRLITRRRRWHAPETLGEHRGEDQRTADDLPAR